MIKYIKANKSDGVYLVDVGILLPETDSEFDNYATVYDREHGYYDEGQCIVIGKERAIAEAKNYVEAGVKSTYGVVSYQGTADEFDESFFDEYGFGYDFDWGFVDYSVDNVIYSAYKDENGKLVENFIK